MSEEISASQLFEGNRGEAIPAGFTAVRVAIDARMHADLQWHEARCWAKECVAKGLKLVWEIELGLFSGLFFPLADQMQCGCLQIGIDYFCNTLWKEFEEETLGLILYRGSIDFSLGFSWDDRLLSRLHSWLEERLKGEELFFEECGLQECDFKKITVNALRKSCFGKQCLRLFCRDIALDYLSLLCLNVPDKLALYLLLDASLIDDPWKFAQLITKEFSSRWHYLIKAVPFSEDKKASLALCMPLPEVIRPSQLKGLQQAFQQLCEKKLPFRLIPEASLTAEWDGLDYLVVSPLALSSQGKRKLIGFSAAGGIVLPAEEGGGGGEES